jgi:hypothetical protein
MTDAPGSFACVFCGSTTRSVRDAQRHWPLVRDWCARSLRFGFRVLRRFPSYYVAFAQHVTPQGFERPPTGCSQPIPRYQTPLLSKQSP